ncbi:MAG TPA: 16S rRNA (guanine(966)-N(2))-methyltransferase RsmD [Actinomycetota bacterium]|nr:16S rRNA (guanine(966)-N(2))-methyltransferase RsmD [Actinomycetota bacterium]
MRVIAGTAKGVRLAPVPRGVRPVSDMAREGLFSSIASEVSGAAVLDLYAGTGALGIEALSRGADAVTFVERSFPARATVLQNLNRTRLAERARIVSSPVGAFLTGDDRSRRPFDLVLIDPPYETPGAEVDAVLAELGSGWLPEHGWTVVLTRPARSSMPVIPVDWHVARRLEYGDTLVLVYREV